MALIDRLAGININPDVPSQHKLGVDAFWALLYELASGQRTKQQIIDYFALTAAEADELQWVIDRYNAQPNATAKAKFVELLRVVFVLAEAQVPGYTTNAGIVARLNAI